MKEKSSKYKTIDVIIETPRNCRNKYTYDKKEKAFRLKKILPVGAVFPFDFGFIPGTKGEDGDPLDVLVIMDEPAYPGCIIECYILGAIKAKQTEHGETVQNDRLIAVSSVSHTHNDLREIKDLNENILKEIEHFFISYNEEAGKTFQPEGWADSAEAMKLIKEGKR